MKPSTAPSSSVNNKMRVPPPTGTASTAGSAAVTTAAVAALSPVKSSPFLKRQSTIVAARETQGEAKAKSPNGVPPPHFIMVSPRFHFSVF